MTPPGFGIDGKTFWFPNLPWTKQGWISSYVSVILEAGKAKPTPHQSGYHVLGAGMTRAGVLAAGGNHEYSITRAIHSEETIVARLLEERKSPDDRIQIIGFAGEPHIPSPCGNCRDVIRQYASDDADIVCGSPNGGDITVVSFSNYLNEYFEQRENPLSALETKALSAALQKENQSYSLYSPEGSYGAALVGNNGVLAAAGLEGDVAYHPSLPLRNALSVLSNSGIDFDVKSVILAAPRVISVPYLERQHLMEFVSRMNAFYGRTTPLPVSIITVDEQNVPTFAWETDSDAWLPYPFSPSKLGMDDQLKQSVEKTLGR